MLLKKKSQDILELADQLDREFTDRQGGVVTGKVVIGSGETKNFNDLAKVISQCLPFIGYPRTLNALRCINEASK